MLQLSAENNEMFAMGACRNNTLRQICLDGSIFNRLFMRLIDRGVGGFRLEATEVPLFQRADQSL